MVRSDYTASEHTPHRAGNMNECGWPVRDWVVGLRELPPNSFKTRNKIGNVKTKLSNKYLSKTERDKILQRKRGLMNYKKMVPTHAQNLRFHDKL